MAQNETITYNGKQVGTMDCTPSWESMLAYYLLVLEEGNDEGKKIAKQELKNMAKIADMFVAQRKAWQDDESFNVGYTRVISDNLLATLVDLQSIVVTTVTGNVLCWIHEWKQTLYCDGKMTAQQLDELTNNSTLSYKVKQYKTITEDTRLWGINSTFRYPKVN